MQQKTNTIYTKQFENIGISRFNTNVHSDINKPQSHDTYEITFLVGGHSEMVVDGVNYKFGENCGVLIRPGQVHYLVNFDPDDCDRFMIRFDARILTPNLQSKLSYIETFFSVKDENILSLFEKLDYYSKKYADDDLRDLYISVITEILHELSESYNPQYKSMNKKMISILEYINNNLADKITLDSLCKQFYQSKTWLYHAFMESVKMPPIKYIEEKRLALANELIMTGNKPTKIYASCGYSDYSSFYRAYVSHYKHPPTTMKPKRISKKGRKTATEA